ncbi:hypothetical protein T03_13141 [Trichinella britovi]|uniref:Uncharacterized protein n=1 Tax=Trichinella britovi TaxID=45882 RepID=A0A0V1AHR8_TRIBR|nr:hypothetical protein T03_13141 [Trichinella britovi]
MQKLKQEYIRTTTSPFHECSAGKPLLHLPRESPCRRMSLVFKGDETGKLDISEEI